MAVSILFNMINVAGQQSNGAIAIGEVVQNSWASHSKLNIGQGLIFGVNNTLTFYSYMLDSDFIDAPINDNDISGPTAQNQSV